MTQTSASSISNELISLLKINDRGWNTALFRDQTTINSSLCGNCDSICCDAVELGCDHDDVDIVLFCNKCLKDLINDNKCPINQHLDPIICPVRSARRQILKSSVICPYSIQYTKQNKNKNIDNNVVIDTIGNDEKEGVEDGCQWKGTLNELLNSDHLNQCTKIYDTTFVQTIQIKKLQNENETLQKVIKQQKQKIDEQYVIITKLQKVNENNKAEIQSLMKIIDDQNKKIQSLQDIDSKENENKIDKNDTDEFDPNFIGETLTLSNNNKIVHNKGQYKYGGYRTCYGKQVISSMDNNKIYIWKLKNIGDTTQALMIGIDNALGKWKGSYYYNRMEKASYCFRCDVLEIRSWNEEEPKIIITMKEKKQMKFANKGDIITMKLKFGSQTDIGGILSYKINDKEEYIACSNVTREDGLKYRLAISTNGMYKTACLQILEFKVVSQ